MSWFLLVTGCASADPPADAEQRIETMYEGYRAEAFPTSPELTVAEVQKRDDVVLVDVRTPKERAVSTLPGAVPAESFDPAAHPGKTVVAYCTIGYRSGEWVEKQRAKGVDAYNLRGSILSWTHAGGALVDAAGKPTTKVHVYGRKWNLVAPGYESVW